MERNRVKKTAKDVELTEKIQKEKAIKNPPNFKITLNEEQKEAKRIALDSDVTVFLGKAGSGKTLVAGQIALDMFFKKEVKKIVIARPLVTAGEDTGYLPGDIKDKTDPYLQPIYDNMYQLIGKPSVDKLIAEGFIEIIPFAYMRGRTFTDSFVILDEAQNCTDKQLEMALGRIGIGSKMIICGDVAQIDLKTKKNSGLWMMKKIAQEVEKFNLVTLQTNHRHPIVDEILKVYETYLD